jgi:hypothetical protein
MQPHTRRTLDGLLAIGPHLLDAQLEALAAYASRTGHVLDVLWAILPGEDAAIDAPESGFPMVAFDDEVAGFTPDEVLGTAADDAGSADACVDWHVAHASPQPKHPTSHLPVYGRAGDRETAADAILCVGRESLDLQLARIEAYAMRAAVRLRGVFIASDPENLRVLLHDFSATSRALGTGPTLTVGSLGAVVVHG